MKILSLFTAIALALILLTAPVNATATYYNFNDLSLPSGYGPLLEYKDLQFLALHLATADGSPGYWVSTVNGINQTGVAALEAAYPGSNWSGIQGSGLFWAANTFMGFTIYFPEGVSQALFALASPLGAQNLTINGVAQQISQTPVQILTGLDDNRLTIFSPSNKIFTVDNLSFNDPAAVPAPSTFILMISGLSAFGLLGRARRRR